MKNKDFKIPLIIALAYWIPSSIVLVGFIKGWEILLPFWLDKILFPGYFIGLVLVFGGGSFGAFIGQLITLIPLFLIGRIIYDHLKASK